ncbi:MAG TPA: DMT family transporter [Magnetospirillaceae bacterium]|jgi:drug/metabolite transporter (DMT)-like permease
MAQASDQPSSLPAAAVPLGAIAALVVLAIVWGGSIPATKLALADMRPLTLTALRYLLAAPFCIPLLIGRRVPPVRALLAMLGLGAISGIIGQIGQVLGVNLTAASVATVIGATIPVLFVLLAAVRLRQPLGPRHIAGLVCAFLGIALVAVGDPRHIADSNLAQGLLGDALMLISAVAVAVYYVGSAELATRYSALTVTAWTTLGSALCMVPVIVGELAVAPFQSSVSSWAVALYLGALVTVTGSWIWFKALARVPARIAGSLQYLQPLVGVGLSAVLFGDRLDAWFAAGTVLVFIGIALSSAPARRRA